MSTTNETKPIAGASDAEAGLGMVRGANLRLNGIPVAEKGNWVRCARAKGWTLNRWVRQALNHAAMIQAIAESEHATGKTYKPVYDEEAFNRMTEAGAKAWADVPDAGKWMDELRGNSEEGKQ